MSVSQFIDDGETDNWLLEWNTDIDLRVVKGAVIAALDKKIAEIEKERTDLLRLAEPYAPDWSQAPEGTMYYTVDYNAVGQWHRIKPVLISGNWVTGFQVARPYDGESLPLGLDSRVLLWARKAPKE